MASEFQNTWQTALEAERELFKSLAEKEPTFAGISHYLSILRAACQNAILQDFESARSIDVEGRLWDAHLKINSRFRKLLSRYREENGKKKKPVEKRKLEKHYLEFIKSSQRFYRGYIQQLSSHFGGIPELEKVARKFNHENLSAQSAAQTAEEGLRTRILQSCHATLIRLGDLSRYRETELVTKDRNWGPAIGYYDLAMVIHPASGASHNQLAVIALADGSHLRATYHLYRALSAHDPHPSARGNLEIEFRKVMSAWAKRELIRPEDAGIPGRALAPWFVYLHAQCYKGVDFPEHDELESEVLSQLAVDLKERSLEGTLQKFCLVNIAAEEFARKRSDEEFSSNARLFFQRINVKTFFTLLQILLAELERFAVEDQDGTPKPEKVTVVARRVLPALRNYSSWLLTVSSLLVAYKEEKDTPMSVQIAEFWKIYANTLTLLASTFEVVNLPDIDYLLEEDEETLGFAPLDQKATSRRYLDANGKHKLRMHDEGVERSHPNIEMLYRIREFVIDGLDLVVGNKIPIALVDDNDKKSFIYKEEGLPSQFFASPSGHHHTLSSTSIGRDDIQRAVQDSNNIADSRSVYGGSQSASASMSEMHRIVEDVEKLVESDTYENAPNVSEQPGFLSNSQLPTPSGNPFESDRGSSAFRKENIIPHSTPMAPPGLGPPMANNAALASSQSFTPLPSILPSIWNTGLSPSGEPSSLGTPRPPPGLEQQPNSMYQPSMNMTTPGFRPSQSSPSSVARDLMFYQQQQQLLRQNQYPNHNGSGPLSSPWTPSSPSSVSMHNRPSGLGTGWDSLTSSPAPAPFGPSAPASSNPMSNSSARALANASWPNDAFIASNGHFPPFSMGYPGGHGYSPGFGNSRRSGTQLGAIGETPPCGQGG
ncbi:uncharacterized protein ASPGLDRAFT_119491 [Aspergillus glaucus CBS 516.65]|uniref:Nonsense-mediated mRNA decay factor n=1 Tax=Aspergillus glaucus CBS 516.65 TaxID=1160497 RepID=A0A1L9VTG1_ASPGL|nr:hypothetical protein ASPGLDRAFT_119491 [Aspergillus glaucus CBS 516.65]OJJ87176.1 hypothetical protein ASPGLDRAFT_119491 [Aspergillus glaucus CBS 516.65]